MRADGKQISALCTGCVYLFYGYFEEGRFAELALNTFYNREGEPIAEQCPWETPPVFGQMVGPPVGEDDQDGDKGVASAGEVVFHLGRDWGVLPADDEAVALQLLGLGGEHLVGDAETGPLPFAVSQRPLPAEAEGDGLFSSPPQ